MGSEEVVFFLFNKTWENKLQRLAARRSTFCKQSNLCLSNLAFFLFTWAWTFLNLSNCLYVSGSNSSETFFIQRREPLYSVLALSVFSTVPWQSPTALSVKTSNSWYNRTNGTRRASLNIGQQLWLHSKPDTYVQEIITSRTSLHIFLFYTDVLDGESFFSRILRVGIKSYRTLPCQLKTAQFRAFTYHGVHTFSFTDNVLLPSQLISCFYPALHTYVWRWLAQDNWKL